MRYMELPIPKCSSLPLTPALSPMDALGKMERYPRGEGAKRARPNQPDELDLAQAAPIHCYQRKRLCGCNQLVDFHVFVGRVRNQDASWAIDD